MPEDESELETPETPEEPSEDSPSPSPDDPPASTLQEVRYLRHLVDRVVPVAVKMRSGEEFRGVVEYYDDRFIRLTREGAPNLFIFKKDIKYLLEEQPAGQ